MGKRIILLLLVLAFLPMVVAPPPFDEVIVFDSGLTIETPNFDILQQNTYHIFNFRAFNTSNGAPLDDDDVNCSFGLINDLGEYHWSNPTVSTLVGYRFYVNVTAANFSEPGVYHFGINCINNLGTQAGVKLISFDVTSNGIELNTGTSIMYASFLGLLIFLFSLNIFVINKLPPTSIRDEDGKLLSISNLKYLRATLWLVAWFLVLGIMFMASNLGFAYGGGEELFANVFFMVFQIMLGLAPLMITVWILWIIAQIIQDKRMRRLWERGMFKQQL